MQTILVKDIPEFNLTVGMELYFDSNNQVYYCNKGIQHNKNSVKVGAKSVLETGSYIKQVPEVGKDYLRWDYKSLPGFTHQKLYPIIGYDNEDGLIQIKNDNNEYSYFQLNAILNTYIHMKIATPKEVEAWLAKKKPCEVGGGMKSICSDNQGFTLNVIYPVLLLTKDTKLPIIKNDNGTIIRLHISTIENFQYIPSSKMPVESTYKLLDDLKLCADKLTKAIEQLQKHTL